MPAVLPLSYDNFRAYTNLPETNVRIESIYGKHTSRVLSFIKKYVTTEDYDAITAAGGDTDTDRVNDFEFAFSRLGLSIMLPVLNTNTVGEGVVESIGFDRSSTKLLSGKELKLKQIELNREALETLEDYLNDDGAILLASYIEKPQRFFRVALIKQTDDPSELWDDLNIWCGY